MAEKQVSMLNFAIIELIAAIEFLLGEGWADVMDYEAKNLGHLLQLE